MDDKSFATSTAFNMFVGGLITGLLIGDLAGAWVGYSRCEVDNNSSIEVTTPGAPPQAVNVAKFKFEQYDGSVNVNDTTYKGLNITVNVDGEITNLTDQCISINSKDARIIQLDTGNLTNTGDVDVIKHDTGNITVEGDVVTITNGTGNVKANRITGDASTNVGNVTCD